jgi:acyl dehydratase
MPIDMEKVPGAILPGTTFSWSEEDVILYNLGVGAGNPPTSPGELKYTYEGDLQVVPAFGTIPPFEMVMGIGGLDGLQIDLVQILHGYQTLTLHRPLPTSGAVIQTGRIVDVYDRQRGAMIVVEVVSTLEGSTEPLVTNVSGVYVRGEGGFGGDPGPAAGNDAPDREPDQVVESPTLPQQALLYRISSGDKNPLHADPGFAAFAGFDRPILHGLCTYGIVSKAVVETVLGGDPGLVSSFTARFNGHVFPGETLVTRIWTEGDRHLISTETLERGTTVLSNAAITTRGASG